MVVEPPAIVVLKTPRRDFLQRKTLKNHFTARFDHLSGRALQDGRGILADREVVVRCPDERDRVAFMFEAGLNDAAHVFDEADHADDRRRQDAAPFGLVIKRDVA